LDVDRERAVSGDFQEKERVRHGDAPGRALAMRQARDLLSLLV
jgi:hypothetical protein